MKKIFIASDHAGYKLKSSIISNLDKIIDLGPKSNDSVDYPDFAKKLSKKVSSNKGSFGILVCGSGMGMAIAANKTKNISINNFGTFMFKKTPQRVGRNPKTLQNFKIKARQKLVFKPSDNIKTSLN